jgi:hypothetical protein
VGLGKDDNPEKDNVDIFIVHVKPFFLEKKNPTAEAYPSSSNGCFTFV